MARAALRTPTHSWDQVEHFGKMRQHDCHQTGRTYQLEAGRKRAPSRKQDNGTYEQQACRHRNSEQHQGVQRSSSSSEPDTLVPVRDRIPSGPLEMTLGRRYLCGHGEICRPCASRRHRGLCGRDANKRARHADGHVRGSYGGNGWRSAMPELP